jgi:hypothetical protein
VGVHASSAGGREAPVRTEPLPTALKRRSMLRPILLVVVVLDLLWGGPWQRGRLVAFGEKGGELVAAAVDITVDAGTLK